MKKRRLESLGNWEAVSLLIFLFFSGLYFWSNNSLELSITSMGEDSEILIEKEGLWPEEGNWWEGENEERDVGADGVDKDGPYLVSRVVDGDTIRVWIGVKEEVVRLIGVDTPESVAPGEPVECFGVEAKTELTELLGGELVYLMADDSQDNRDRYGRLLRYVWLETGELVNSKIISAGWGEEFTYKVPYEYQAKFMVAEEQAKIEQTGMWGLLDC